MSLRCLLYVVNVFKMSYVSDCYKTPLLKILRKENKIVNDYKRDYFKNIPSKHKKTKPNLNWSGVRVPAHRDRYRELCHEYR